MTSEEYLDKYRTYLSDEKKASENTCSSYVRDVRQYGEYLADKFDKNYDEAKEEQINGYISQLREKGRAASTISRNIASLKNFYAWMNRNGYVEEDPSVAVASEKVKHKLPEILTPEEIDRFLSAPQLTDRKGYRDKAMLELMYATGIRVTELIDLDLSDVNLDGGYITCRNRDKVRTIPLYPAAISALRDYIDFIRPGMAYNNNVRALFLNLSGHRMSRQGIWKIVKCYQNMAGIEKEVTPHTIRHSFASHMLENGADLHFIQQMLGHADISSTQLYSQIVKKNIKQQYNQAHPKASNEV